MLVFHVGSLLHRTAPTLQRILHGDAVLGVPRERFVVPHGVQVVLPVPAGTAEVAETLQLPAEVRPLLDGAQATYGILQVRVHLNLLVQTQHPCT